ncbi:MULTISPECIES: stage V sporulation protein T [Mediterraneibacter]|uniref:stage V sporulation protein T n=1 Tax=Mediterraneibacter TaxID=2316020 RepID=UPI0022E24B6A|nr:stage V sporulation protein T [Mediterraneibacter massiliensis]
MKATGIVRRIDDLGRVVIPKEIRRTLRIREGDPLEIFTDREGEIILKKYSPIGELGTLARLYSESLAQTMGCTVCITDMDQIVAVSGNGKKELKEAYITKELEHVLQQRVQVTEKAGSTKFAAITAGTQEYIEEIISPILCEGDVIGSVVFLRKEEKKKFGEVECKVAQSAAEFLGRQMEQ